MIERIIVGPFHTNTYIVTTGKKECLIIDPGAEPETILSRLEVLNVRPVAVVLTHGHIDHLSACNGIRAKYENDALQIPVYLHEKDMHFLENDSADRARSIFEPFGDEGLSAFDRLFDLRPDNVTAMSDGFIIPDTDLTVIHTPGHTEGSVTIYSETLAMAWTGDTVFFKAIGRTDFADGNDMTIEQSVHEKIFVLPEETRLFPGHGPDTTVEREKSNNDFSVDHLMI